MTETVRIPKAQLSGVQGSLLRLAIGKELGRVPDNVPVERRPRDLLGALRRRLRAGAPGDPACAGGNAVSWCGS
jgi:hypothetical protein